MAASSTSPPATSCQRAIAALQQGRWQDWHGLPPDCTLAGLDALFGGSTVLDIETLLGQERIDCSRSSLNEAPIIVWHRGQDVLLIECDLLQAPAAAPSPSDATIHRLDLWWGAAHLAGGEWLMPDRGLALTVTSDDKVVACLGFAPTSVDGYIAKLRPERTMPVPPPVPRATTAQSRSTR